MTSLRIFPLWTTLLVVTLATAPVASAQTMYAVATTELRAERSPNAQVLATIPQWSEVKITFLGRCEHQWCAVTYNEQSGFAAEWLLTESSHCIGTPGMASSPPPEGQSPYNPAYLQSWLNARRREGADVSFPSLGSTGQQTWKVREAAPDYFHIHRAEEHFCVPYAAVKKLQVVGTGSGQSRYTVTLFDEWLKP
jgi:hypothetical protein